MEGAMEKLLILDHRERLQGQSKIVDLCLKDLFQALSGLFPGVFGGVTGRCVRLATARAYSSQTSCGASSTYSMVV
jgi:hypothetical protein